MCFVGGGFSTGTWPVMPVTVTDQPTMLMHSVSWHRLLHGIADSGQVYGRRLFIDDSLLSIKLKKTFAL